MRLESKYSSALLKKARETLPTAVFMKHINIRGAGVPDISMTWLKMTSWWEVKIYEKKIFTRGVQLLQCRKLAVLGHCYFIIYHLPLQLTLVRNALHFPSEDDLHIGCDAVFPGRNNHRAVVDFMISIHERVR